MKTMKILLVLLMGITLTSCAVSDEDKVKQSASGFLKALGEYDFEEAASYCDDSTKQLILSMEGLMEEYGGDISSLPKSKFTITSVEVNNDEVLGDWAGNFASVTYLDNEGKSDQLYLIKVDNEWKVSIDKDELNKEEMDKEE